MPYQEHPKIKTPGRNVKIWRYFDLMKFLSLIEQGSLFFPNIKNLDDPMEGDLTNPTIKQFLKTKIGRNNLYKIRSINRNYTYICSWHMNKYESAAMWQIYKNGDFCVAIQSTVGKLIKSLSQAKEDIQIGKVKYLDYNKDEINWMNIFNIALCKRKSFEFERELRAIILNPLPKANVGISTKVDLNILIEKVFVAPQLPNWQVDLIEKILKKYDLNCLLEQSELDKKPIY